MSFIQRELDRIHIVLTTTQLTPECDAAFYAAQQALGWALDPASFKSPYDMIVALDAQNPDDLPA